MSSHEQFRPFGSPEEARDPSFLRLFLGGLVGFFVGGALGFYIALIRGKLAYGQQFAELAFLVTMIGWLCGAFAGVLLGAFVFDRWPRLFLVTFLPLGILLVVQQVTVRVLRSVDRPREYILSIEGSPGAEFAGTVSIHGEVHKLRGRIPARYKYEGLQLRCAFALVDLDREHEIGVEASAGGRSLQVAHRVPTGLRIEINSSGYTEIVKRSGAGWQWLSYEDAEQFVATHQIPEGFSKPGPKDFQPRIKK